MNYEVIAGTDQEVSFEELSLPSDTFLEMNLRPALSVLLDNFKGDAGAKYVFSIEIRKLL